jgi:hypothetical protein
MTAAIIGTLILIFTIIKLLSILGDEATIWAWVGLVLAIVIAAGAFMTVQEAGGVDTLRTEASGLSSSMQSGSAAAAPASSPPPPPPAEPLATPDTPSEAAAEDAVDDAADAVDSAEPGEQSDREL